MRAVTDLRNLFAISVSSGTLCWKDAVHGKSRGENVLSPGVATALCSILSPLLRRVERRKKRVRKSLSP